MADDKHTTEIILGNKNVAEAGSQQINITQNNFDPAKMVELLRGLQGEQPAPTPETTTADKPKGKPGRKKKAPRIVTDTYKYRWIDRQEGQLRLIKLYQLLIDERFKMLSVDVKPDDWCALFTGETKAFTMKWTGKQAHLRCLFKLLLEKGYITHDEKSAGKWEILGSHFVNKSGRPFSDWDSQYDPKRGAKTLQMFAEVLNIATTMPNTDSFEDDIRAEMDEFADYEKL